jgi:GAF domain-containing protein
MSAPLDFINQYSATIKHLEASFMALRASLTTALKQIKRGEAPSEDLMPKISQMYQAVTDLQSKSAVVLEQVTYSQELLRVFSLLNSSLDLERVLKDIMDTIIDLTGAERAYLMMYDEAGVLNTHAARNWDRASLSAEEVNFSSSIVQSAINSQQAVLTFNAQDDDRFQAAQSIADQKLRSIICIPLVAHQKALGVVYADNRVMKGVFRQEMIPLLNAFGQQAAIAIQNARNYGAVQQDLRTANQQLQRLEVLVDKAKLQKELDAVVDSDFFRELSQIKRSLKA